jgi:phospholipid/cholesterol/gamma-HCH transport system ATP-binding protein
MDAQPLLELDGIKLAFDQRVVLEGLALDVRRGESLAILGPSGSGKSVLLKLLIGLIKPDAGCVRFAGRDLVPLSEEALAPIRARMAMLFQGGALFDSLTVGENVAYPLRVVGGFDEDTIAARVRERLAVVGLPDTEGMLPGQLSGGMKKRVALARALAGDPEVILYDEPTTGLDVLTARRIDDLIRSVQRRLHVTSVVVTHDLASALRVSDRIAMLGSRRIELVLPTKNFLDADVPAVRELREAMSLP